MKRNRRSKHLRVSGTIVPVKKDTDGNVTCVAIRPPKSDELWVERSRLGMELIMHIDEDVSLEGTIRERLDGRTLIKVAKYQLSRQASDDSTTK